MQMENLNGKVSIVTGAAMGIGKAVALRLARDGSDIVAVDMDKDRMQETVREIQALGRRASAFAVDISNWPEVNKMVDDVVSTYQKIDILVNSAGILGPNVPVWEYAVEDWDRVMTIDLKGTFLVCKAVIGPMRKRKSGRIVTLASMAGKDGNPFMCAYTAAKAAVIAFTRSLALEVVQDGIVVNAIAPSVIEGRIAQSVTDEQRQVLLSKIPMGALR